MVNGKTIAVLTVPFIFLDQGDYPVLINDINPIRAVIYIKHERNQSGMPNIMGVQVSAPGASSIGLSHDQHGIMNFTRIKIELPYLIYPTKIAELPDGTITDLSYDNHFNVIKDCILYLNRLIEIKRWMTGQYWINYLSGQDVFLNQFDLFDGAGKNVGGQLHMTPVHTSFNFPVNTVEQSKVWQSIIFAAGNGEKSPIHDKLYLDSITYFSQGRFNEAVMLMNTAFESATTEYFYNKLKLQGISNEEIDKKIDQILDFQKKKGGKKGWRKVLSIDLKEITGRSLEDDNPTLWEKFDKARNTRKNTLHPFIKRLNENESRTAMLTIVEVMNWIWNDSPQKTII